MWRAGEVAAGRIREGKSSDGDVLMGWNVVLMLMLMLMLMVMVNGGGGGGGGEKQIS